ncbi:zinc finger and SCAN domain-containing protein 16-like isoform X2 [Rhineura floridana]|uniref:zinc finger and SCAN domain-containing protein 16-like isoform X2 n=1 Tax=Rhineura floridana TaxID=261503 RepID=UPI002AC7F39B|nr:zinc finger and SCAN domain-containing protein 16-like isoform X2 [Rhineura floridana]
MALEEQEMRLHGQAEFGHRRELGMEASQEMGAGCQTGIELERLKEEGPIVEADHVTEFPRWEGPNQVKQEPEERLHQHWEAQWQELLKTVECPLSVWGVPQSAEEPTPWDDAKAFLASFEQVAKACRWPKAEWATRLLPALSGEAEQAFSRLEARDREDYGKVKAAILRGDALSREKQRQHFRRYCYQEAEGPRGVYNQLEELCHRWLKVERHSKEQILEALILEQFLTILPQDMQSWVRGNSPETCFQAVALAEDFLQREQAAKKQRPQVPGLFEEHAVGFSEVRRTQLGAEVRSVSGEVKEETAEDASLLEVCKEANENNQHHLQWERPEKVEVHQITLGQAQQDFPQCWKLGVASVNEHVLGRAQGNSPEITVEECRRRGPVQSKPHEAPLHPGAHKGKSKNICADCGKTFKWNSRLMAHRRMHTGEKPYKCSLCGKSFRRNAHLFQHHRIHTGEKPYKCSDCGKSFNDKSSFLKHRRTHTGDKPFQCSSCGKSFIQSSHLSRHQRTHAKENL